MQYQLVCMVRVCFYVFLLKLLNSHFIEGILSLPISIRKWKHHNYYSPAFLIIKTSKHKKTYVLVNYFISEKLNSEPKNNLYEFFTFLILFDVQLLLFKISFKGIFIKLCKITMNSDYLTFNCLMLGC